MPNEPIVVLGAGNQALETQEYANELGIEISYFITESVYKSSALAKPFISFEEIDPAIKKCQH